VQRKGFRSQCCAMGRLRIHDATTDDRKTKANADIEEKVLAFVRSVIS